MGCALGGAVLDVARDTVGGEVRGAVEDTVVFVVGFAQILMRGTV